jgi:hypothetical protein
MSGIVNPSDPGSCPTSGPNVIPSRVKVLTADLSPPSSSQQAANRTPLRPMTKLEARIPNEARMREMSIPDFEFCPHSIVILVSGFGLFR